MVKTPFILLVEDHQKILVNTMLQLREEGFAVHAVDNVPAAHDFLTVQQPESPDLLILDVRLGSDSGIDLIQRLINQRRFPPTIIISGEASITETVEALRLGVYDFIEKPFTRERLLQSVRNCLEHASLRRELTELRSRADVKTILGRSPETIQLRERIEKVAATEARVLIRGESGTGKELVANMLHRHSSRRHKPFVKTNCAAIPAHLIEDELFGHARGAFTDAKHAKAGLFEEADGGTLLLDEIGDMDIVLQSRLLRILEDGKVRRIGETQERQVNVRVIAASNRDLQQLVGLRLFREDLYFRIATVPIDVPPLRDRVADIALLFTHFLEVFCGENQRRRLTLDPEVIPAIERYRWPGNVRELRNVCEQLSIFGSDPITIDQLPTSILRDEPLGESGVLRLTEATAALSLRNFRELCEREYIERVLRRVNWSFPAAAKILDIQRTYLHQKVTALKIARQKRE